MLNSRKVFFTASNNSEQGLRLKIQGDFMREPVSRSEGGKTMILRENEYKLKIDNHHPEWVHPDLLALSCVLAFHPALPLSSFDLVFNFPVSERLINALRLPYILPQARIFSDGQESGYVPSRYAGRFQVRSATSRR